MSQSPYDSSQPIVGIVMGSDSDWSVMEAAAEVLDEFGIPYEADVVSAHRMPEDMIEYGKKAHSRGIRVIIAGAGGAAHLPGMLASVTALPVIGVPVATVSINGARNAGLLALRILGSGTDAFAQQVHADLRQFSQDLRQTAMDKGAALRTRVAEAKAKAAAEREAEESSSAPRPASAPEASSEPQAYVP